jgi:DNA-3-methyladenine glycosylase II
MQIFKYGETEINYLKSVDSTLGHAIDRLGKLEREIMPDLFTALIYAIVGQQISTKAVATIWKRMLEKFTDITPESLLKAEVGEIQQCGMSTRKAQYIISVSETIASGKLKLSELYNLSDDEVVKRLSSLNGVGIWTAEMLMLHSMERSDVVSFGDIAIRRGMMKLYGLESLSRKQFQVYRSRYSPYGSVASIYLWKLSHELQNEHIHDTY